MSVLIANGAWATLASGISDSATTINLTAGQGARFGTIGSPDFMYLTLIKAASGETEHVKVTNRSTDTLTVTRGQDGSSAIAFDAGDRIECRPINAVLQQFVQLVLGKVGIGTSSPSFDLHIAKASGDADARVVNAGSTGTDTANFQASAGSTSVQSIAYGSGEAYFIGTAPTSVTYGNAGAGPVLFIQNNVARGRIDANGYLLWGYASSNGSYPLQVNGQIFATSSTVATSDGRYKDNVAEISGGLAIVDALRPVTFNWKPHPIHNFDTQETQVGFIAQEVDTALDKAAFKGGVVPSGRVRIPPGGKDRGGRVLAQGVDETFLGLAEGKLIPILTCAIKELKAIVDAQAARIDALEARR